MISPVVHAVAGRSRPSLCRRSRTAVALVALAVLSPNLARAQTAIPITTTATGARALALAGVGVTPAFGAAAAHTNPAALVGLEVPAFALAHRIVAPGVAQQGGVFALPWRGRAAFAVGADVYRVDGEASTDALLPGRDAAYAARAGLHTAVALPHEFAVGIGVAHYASTLEPQSVRGWCTDAGLHWQGYGFRAGAALRGWSLGATAPGEARAWSAGVARGWNQFDVAAQVDGDRAGTRGTAAAVAWRAAPRLELRAGGRHDADAGETFGTGFAVAAGGAQLEWGCRFGRGVRMENVVGLAVAFGSAAPRAAAKAPPQRRRAETDAAPQAPPAAVTDRVTTPVLPDTRPADANTSPSAANTSPSAANASPSAANASPSAANAPSPAKAPPAPAPSPSKVAPKPQAPAAPPIAPPASMPRLPETEDTAPKASGCYSVRGGTHRSLEDATPEIFRLRRADLSVGVERSGDQFVVVVRRCVSQSEAKELQARAQRVGVRCSIVAE